MKNSELTCTSWLNGKHDTDVEINVSYSTVSIGDWFFQGEAADEVIDTINVIYNSNDVSVLEAVRIYESQYL